MIQFDSLKVEGGLSFKEPVLFPLQGQGLTCILGKNLDDTGSNGSGKSSIGELLTHVLYATTAKGLKKNDIVCDLGSKGYLGHLKFSNGGVPYEVLQARGHSKEGTAVKLFINGKDQAIKGLNESQEAVKRVLGLTFEEWHSTTYLSQQMKHLFIRSAENDAKKSMLARIFSLNYQAMKDEADLRLKETRVALLALKSNIATSKAALEQSLLEMGNPNEADMISKIEQDEALLASMKEKIQILSNRLSAYMNYKVALAKSENYKRLLDQQALELNIPLPNDQTEEYVAGIENHIKGLNESLTTFRAHLKSYRDYLPHVENRDRMKQAFIPYESWPEELRQMGSREKDLMDLQIRLKELDTLYGDYSGFDRLAALKAQNPPEVSAEAKQTLSELKIRVYTELSAVNNSIAAENRRLEASKNGTCISCGQAISPEHLAHVQAERDRLEVLHRDLYTQYEQAQKDEKDLIEKERVYTSWKTNLQALSTFEGVDLEAVKKEKEYLKMIKIANLQAEILKVKEYIQACEALKPYLSVEGEVEAIRKQIKDLEETEQNISNQIPRFQNFSTTLKEYFSTKITPVEEVDELAVKAETSNLQDASVNLAGEVASRKKDLETLRGILYQLNAIKGKEDEIQKLETCEQIYESLGYAFGPKGLIVERLGTICEYMNEKANYFLSKIMKDIKLQFGMDGDSIDLDILINGKTRGTGNLSGGEGAKVGLACMLGLRSLIPDKNQTNMLILDEVEANFDDRVRFELMDLLKATLESTSLDTILMVSHSQALQDSMDWDSKWVVTKRDGCSSLQIL